MLNEQIMVVEEEILTIKRNLMEVLTAQEKYQCESSTNSNKLQDFVSKLEDTSSKIINLINLREKELFGSVEALNKQMSCVSAESQSVKIQVTDVEKISNDFKNDLIRMKEGLYELKLNVNPLISDIHNLKKRTELLANDQKLIQDRSFSFKDDFTCSINKQNEDIQQLKMSVMETQSNSTSLEMGKRIEEQSNYLFNESQLLHQILKEQKNGIEEFQNKILCELENLKVSHMEQFNLMFGNITQTFSTQINTLSFDYSQLHNQVSNLAESIKILYGKVDSEVNHLCPNNLSLQHESINMAEQKDLLDKVRWLKGECETLSQQCLSHRQESDMALQSLSTNMESALVNQINRLREDYDIRLQEIRSYIDNISFNGFSRDFNLKSSVEVNNGLGTEMELEKSNILERNPNGAEEQCSEDDDKKQCEVLHNLAVQLRKLKQAYNSQGEQDIKLLNSEPDCKRSVPNNPYTQLTHRKPLSIPWNGKILSPTVKQLRECEGNLGLIETKYGSRPMKEEEKNFRLRFIWKNWVLWPTIQQLELAQGDLNRCNSLMGTRDPKNLYKKVVPNRSVLRGKL